MGMNFESLTENINEFLQTLSPNPAGSDDSEKEDREPPRLELIDFDKLRMTLAEAVGALAAAKKLDEEAEYVKRWFALRINAIRRGRQALMSAPVNGRDVTAESQLSLAEHLRLYDEESGQLKREVRKSAPVRSSLSAVQQERYKQFRA